MVTVAVERGRIGISRRAPTGRRETAPGGSVKTRRIGRGAGSASVDTVTQRPVVGVEGRRVVVGREGAPALVGLGTSVLGFKDGRRRLAAVCCQLMVFLRQSLGLSRGVDEGETDECRLDPRVRKESRCHRGSGRVSVGGVHGVGRRYPEVPVFKQF